MSMDPELIEADLRRKFMKTLEAFINFTEDRDKRLLSLLGGVPPPKDLIDTRDLFMIWEEITPSARMKKLLKALIASCNRKLDLFEKSPVLIEGMMKKAAGEDEMEVIG